MENHIIRYSLPAEFNVEVETYFKGQIADSNLFEKNPELWNIYPTRVTVVRKYKDLKKIAEKEGKLFVMKISEEGINIFEKNT